MDEIEDVTTGYESNAPADAGLSTPVTGYDAFKAWAKSEPNMGISESQMDAGLPPLGHSSYAEDTSNKVTTDVSEMIAQANKSKDTSEFTYKPKDISNRYKATFKGIDNESLYAANQTLGEKAYNGVAKMVGTASTAFINGTAGLVYGIAAAADAESGHRIHAFYNNDLSNFLNNVNTEWEDKYAHYKTERERNGDWWEPSNLFTANFLFDNVVKNLGFSVGSMAAGFGWGAALKGLGMTAQLMGKGAQWATAADAAIAESALLPNAQRLAAMETKIAQLYNSSKSAVGGALMKADRGIVATFGTFGEASMEALGNSQQFREEMLNNFREQHGYDPNKDEMAAINENAEKVGNWSFGLNTMLLTATNYIQLPKIYSSSFRGEKAIANNIALAGEHYASTLPEKGFGKLMYKAKNLASLGFNTSEAFEEGAQFAIQTGTQNYFNRKYSGEKASAIEDGLLFGVKEALTTGEGTLNIFTGGFSGALQSSGVVGMKGFMPVIGQTGKIGERGWTGYGGEEAQTRDDAIKALNGTKIRDKMKDVFSNIKMAEGIQADREAAIRRGDILEAKDLEMDYAHTFIASRLKYGAKAAIDNEISMLREQAQTDFTSLQQEEITSPSDTQQTFIARLDNLQAHADHAAKLYDAANLKYSGLLNDKKERRYTDEVIDKLVYAGSKVMDYNKRIPQLTTTLSPFGINVDQILKDIVIDGVDSTEAMASAKAILDEKGGIESEELKTNLDDLVEVSLRRKEFIEEYKDMVKNPDKYKQGYAEPTAPENDTAELPEEIDGYKTGKSIEVVTKTGPKTLKTGKTFILGRVVEHDKNGNEVYRAPTLTILTENADGTIKVKLSSGLIRDITKKDLEDYKLVPIEKRKENQKLDYFMKHWNSVYEYYGKKINGKPIKGRLEYNDEKEGVLTFVYLDKAGKRQEIEVANWMFKATKKYKHPMMRHIGELTAEQAKAEEVMAKTQDRNSSSVLNKRLDIIVELSEDLLDRQEKTKKLVETKQASIAKMQEELEQKRKEIDLAQTDARYKKFIKFKKVTSDAIEIAMGLSRSIKQLEREVEAHEADLIDLENNLEYIDIFIEDLEEQPLAIEDFIAKLRLERREMVGAIQSANKSINLLHKVIASTQRALDSAADLVLKIIQKFDEKYPEFPFSLRDIINENHNFLKVSEKFEEDLGEAKEMVRFIEEGEIIPDNYRMLDLQKHLELAHDDLRDLEKQLKAHDVILDKFKERLADYRRMQIEEKKMVEIEALRKEFLGTLTKSVQNFFGKFSYEAEARKDDWDVVGSTKAFSEDTAEKPLPAHHVRANHFGARLATFENKEDIGGSIVTAATEDQIIPGLSDHFLDDIKDPEKKEAARKEVIYLVMVATDAAGKVVPVDMNGKPIAEKAEDETFDDYHRRLRENAVYQVFPQEKLTTVVEQDGKTKVKSMFREDTDPEVVASLKKQYADWREAQLKAPKIADNPEKIVASFGFPELNYYVDEEGNKKVDKSKRTSAEAAGLINEGGLNADRLVIVATNNEAVFEGKVTFRTPLGRVFLRIPGQGLAKLFNRKLNTKETSTIFDAMLQLSKNALNYNTLQATYTDPETGEDIDNPRAAQNKTILNWLESVIYWGVARDYTTGKQKAAGYNNVWFEEVTENGKPNLKLFISGINKDATRAFDFTPTGLERDKEYIVGLLNGMYNNTNATKVNQDMYSAPYEEITGFDSQGNPKITTWPNYQSYLLSEKAPGENGHLTVDRDVKEIPLATQFRPLEGKDDTNRKGIYFSLESTVDNYEMPVKKEPKPKKEAKEKKEEPKKEEPKKEGAPKGKQKTGDLTKPENWTLDGKTENTKVLINKLGNIIFTLDIKGIVKSLPKDKAELKAIFDDKKALPKELLNALNKQFIDLSHKNNLKTVENLAEYYESKGMKEAVAETQAVSTILTSLFRDVTPQILEEIAPSKDPVKDKKTKPKKEKKEEPKKKEKKEKGKKEEPVEKKPADITVEEEEEDTDDFDDEWNDTDVPPAEENRAFRVRLENEAKQFKAEDWDKLEAFIAKVLPNFPLYRVQNVIRGMNGKEGWGMFHKGAIYVMEAAEIGTGYHEVFEAVWKAFVGPEDKQQLIDEFRTRVGSYVDRETQERINFSDATDAQIKEQLAEEFRDKVLTGKDPAKYGGEGLIARMFNQLLDFIREFFTGKNAIENTTKLFEAIGNGYYAQYNPYAEGLSYAEKGVIDIDEVLGDETSEFRPKLPETELHDIIQHMTYTTLTSLTRGNKSFFEVSKKKRSELYPMLRTEIISRLKGKKEMLDKSFKEGRLTDKEYARSKGNLKALYNKFKEEWDNIVIQHADHLRLYNVEFDENDEIHLTAEENSGKQEYDAANKIDSFRKANSAIKLLFGTLAETEVVDGVNRFKPSSIGGVNLIPADKVNVTLTNELHNSVNIDDMFDKLSKFALGNPNYAALYERMTNQVPGVSYNPAELEDFDIQIMTAFWKTIKKQNADVITVFILPSGDIIVSDSTLNTSFKQAKREILEDIGEKIRKERSPYFSYDPKTGKYSARENLKKIQFGADLAQYVSFLNNLGINFKLKDIKKLGDNIELFKEAVSGLQSDIKTIGDMVEVDGKKVSSAIAYINIKTLNADRNLTKLGIVKAIIDRTDFESTYFNVNGERTQTFIGGNVVSNLHDVLSKLKNIKELDTEKKYSHYAYLRTDVFSKGSALLKKMFDLEGANPTGRRKEGTEGLLKPVFIDGLVDQESGKKKASSKLTLKQRLTQEINLNLSGIFLNLVPGDASIEHAIRMYNKRNPFVSEETFKSGAYLDLFRDLLASEIELSRDDRPVKQEADAKGKNTDLRFFQAILGSNPELVKTLTDKKNKKISPEELIEQNKDAINEAIEEFIAGEALDTEGLLRDFGILYADDNGFKTDGILLGESKTLTRSELNLALRTLAANYVISNMEMHKLIYSDPYQYSDELKRIKNFNSPGQPLVFGSEKIRKAFDKKYNAGYKKGQPGWSDMIRDHFRSVTFDDIWSVGKNLGYDSPYEETDGGGYITLMGLRKFKLAAGDWTDANEKQYKHDIAYEVLVKNGATKAQLALHEKDNPNEKSTYTPLKPIVRGSKQNGRKYNDVMLDKFALVPLSFRILHELNPNSNALKLYNKMQKEDIDYGVFASGRKVGAEKTSPLLTSKGEFDETPFETAEELKKNVKDSVMRGVTNVPFAIVAVQSEVPSKDSPIVTQGSQITKLATMDYLEAGMPIDFLPGGEFDDRFVKWMELEDKASYNDGINLYNEIKNNEKLLVARMEEGVEALYKKLGLEKAEVTNDEGEIEHSFIIKDPKKLSKTLKDELAKREINSNIAKALEGFEKGHVVLEATPAYQQIRNVLFSIADKTIVRPKISGGQKVQIPSSLLSDYRVTTDKVTKKGKPVYESEALEFYKDEDGKRVCEIMVGRWFKSNLTDEQLLHYFNKTKEGQAELAALQGVGFRIPTQKQNSIDVFKIKQFLPQAFGDSVVIPSGLVKKAGSDFDIDKLSLYFKNLYKDSNDNLRVVPYFGTGAEAKAKFAEMFDKGELLTEKQHRTLNKLLDNVANGDPETKLLLDMLTAGLDDEKKAEVEKELFGESGMFSNDVVIEDFLDQIQEGDANVREITIDSMYKQSLENAYISSLEKLISHPLNYDNLVKPNDASQMRDLSDKIQKKLGNEKIDYSSTGNMLSRRFMSDLRHAFVTGKYAIGIAAVAQVGHAQRQRSTVTVDMDRLTNPNMDPSDVQIMGGDKNSPIFAQDSNINFKEYNSVVIDGKRKPVLSMAKNKAGDYISDIIGQFIDGYVDIAKGPWIMKLGATPNVAGTWLYLLEAGVPATTVSYFMNQPAIRDYLQGIDNAGYSWLFIDTIFESALDKYAPEEGKGVKITGIPGDTALFGAINKKVEDMSPKELSEQQYMLKEFLKYAKTASQLFEVTQGSNFDTATINDPYLVFKKMLQLAKARNTVISSVDDILDSSFVGPLKDTINEYRNAFAQILISDKKNIRSVMEKVLLPYVNKSDRDFVKISQKAVNDLFDWAVQNKTNVNSRITTILLGNDKEESAASQIMDYVYDVIGDGSSDFPGDTEHPLYNNIIINSIKKEVKKEGGRGGKGKVQNLYLKGRDNKVYDQNLIIHGFAELRDHLKTENNLELYGKLTRLALLQSGLSNSPIAFTNLLPYEDFKDLYNDTLYTLEQMDDLMEFYNLDVFQRNNANNSDVATFKSSKMYYGISGYTGIPYKSNLDTDTLLNTVKADVADGTIPKIVGVSTMSGESRSDYIVYQWEDDISREERILRKKTQDRRHIHKVLAQKVYREVNGKKVPVIQKTKGVNKKTGQEVIYEKYIYKAMNVWGDSFRAQEFYDYVRPSVLDNDFDKVVDANDPRLSGEVEDAVIAKYFRTDGQVETNPKVGQTPKKVKEAPVDKRVEKVVGKKDKKKNSPKGKPDVKRSNKKGC